MRKSVKGAAAAILGAIVMMSASANAGVVYTSDQDTGNYFNLGPNVIVYDDVTVTNLQPNIDLTRITVGIRKPATVLPFTVTFYAFPITDTGDMVGVPLPLSAPVTVAPSQDDGITLVSLGDGVTTLASVALNEQFAYTPGSGSFAVGIVLNTSSSVIGWSVSSGPDANQDAFGRYNLADPGASSNRFGFNLGGSPRGSFYLIVEGSAVPEPVMAGLLVPMGALLMRRRQR